MKARIFFITFLLLVSGKSMKTFADAQEKSTNSETLFFDDFEKDIDGWKTQNTISNAQWYWNSIEGFEGSNSASFTLNLVKPYDINDAWFVTPEINTETAEYVKINFKYMRWGDYLSPRLYYTYNFTGDVETTIWNEIENVEWGSDVLKYYDISPLEIETPGNNFRFAFRYQTTQEIAAAFYIENFKIESYIPPVPFEKVGSSENFEFYTNISGESNYWPELKDKLEVAYLRYKSIWERPSSNTVFPPGQKVKIKYCSREDIPKFDANTPVWDCGSFDFQSGEIYLTNPESIDQQEYYGDVASIAVNELAQMALKGWLDRDSEAWYSEGFGLHEMGYRPDRTQLLQKLSAMGTEKPEIDQIVDISQLNVAGNKDLMASLFESKALIHCNFYGHWGNDLYKWWQLLKHYYIKNVDRIELLYSTEHFDFYAAAKENPYILSMATNMEEQLSVQESRFYKTMDHRVSVCIYDNEVGLEINNRTDFQGLANPPDNINTSHLEIGHYGLANHEFMHIWVNMLSPFSFDFLQYPGQFINEGLAESTDRFMADEEMPFHNYKIQGLYYHYQRKYNREPTWMEIVDNAEVNAEDGFWVDAYALGEMYWRYMNDKYPVNFWEKVKLFLQNGRDWSVFGGKTSEQEGAEFIQFMKELAFVGPPLETTSIPFYENFRNDFKGWTLMRYGADDYWKINNDIGYDDQFCAFAVDPNWMEEKKVDSWLISPPLDAATSESLDISFMYRQTGQAIKPEIYYTGNFTGPTATTNWIPVEGIQWNAVEGQWDKMKFTIVNPPEKLFIALRFQANYGDIFSYCIDNFEVKITSPFDIPTISTNEATSESQTSAMLNGAILSDGGTSITQRGFYWSSTNTSPNSGDHIELVAGTTGSFSKTIENLTPETSYYYRTFATNSVGIALGEAKQFKTLTAIILADLPFFDGFEQNISNDAIFDKWTTENIEGWHYWHIIPGGGVSGQCMRFENTDVAQNDWLITKPINCAGANNLNINFYHLYHINKIPPRLYYTNQYNGNASQSTWKELTYTFGENENQWYPSGDFIIENPGDVIYFAFNYQAAANSGAYFLLDNFSVEEITTGVKVSALSRSNLKVYPNPKTDKSVVSFTNNIHGNVTLAIYDLKGRKLFTIVNEKLAPGTYNQPIDKHDLPNGLYVVQLLTPQEQSAVKLIVTD